VGQVYTGAYTEGIAVYFLTLLGLTRGAVQMCLCKETPSRKTGGKWHQAAMRCAGRGLGWPRLAGGRAAPGPGGWEPPAPPPGRQPSLRPCSKFALITASSSGKPHLEERLLGVGAGAASQLSQAGSVV